jgi:tRNA threonylcarbamoyladenosine biosynthesis protein TsaE
MTIHPIEMGQKDCPEGEKVIIYSTTSDEETIELGLKLGRLLREGDVIALVGELGSGKTWFTKGIARGVGIHAKTVITSPSFALVNAYDGGRHPFFHVDLYRLTDLSDIVSIGLEEYLHSGGVVVMEWADRCPDLLPERTVRVEFTVVDNHRRRITVSGIHPMALEIIKSMEQEVLRS